MRVETEYPRTLPVVFACMKSALIFYLSKSHVLGTCFYSPHSSLFLSLLLDISASSRMSWTSATPRWVKPGLISACERGTLSPHNKIWEVVQVALQRAAEGLNCISFSIISDLVLSSMEFWMCPLGVSISSSIFPAGHSQMSHLAIQLGFCPGNKCLFLFFLAFFLYLQWCHSKPATENKNEIFCKVWNCSTLYFFPPRSF